MKKLLTVTLFVLSAMGTLVAFSTPRTTTSGGGNHIYDPGSTVVDDR